MNQKFTTANWVEKSLYTNFQEQDHNLTPICILLQMEKNNLR